MNIEKIENGLLFRSVPYKAILLLRLLQARDRTEEITTLPPEVRSLGAKNIAEIIELITTNRITDIEYSGRGKLDIRVEEIVPEGRKPISREDLDRLFKDTVVKYILEGIETEIAGIIKDTYQNVLEDIKKKPKTSKIRRSGHLQDQILKYRPPTKGKKQLSIWDSLQENTKKDIEIAGIERTEIVEGIKLSPSETKLIDCLCKLLHERSQTTDPDSPDYYSGNQEAEISIYSGEKTPAPKLAFTLYELTREYKGGDKPSGKDIQNVKQILQELDNRRFLLSYVETTRRKDGSYKKRKIEDLRKLIHIIKISETEFSKENIELSKQEETLILLSPIFRRQIDSKFILYPADINKRTIIAYGSHNLSEATLRLRDYLIREHSSKHYKPEIGLEKLYYLLAEKWMIQSRKKKVKEYTDRAIEAVKALGLLLDYKIEDSSTGEPKVVFTLNKDWE